MNQDVQDFKVTPTALEVAVQGTLGPAPKANEGTVGRQTWEELDHIYQTSAESLVSIMAGITNLVGAASIIDKEATDNTLGFVVKAVSEDANKFSKDFVKLHNQHKDRTGEVGDDDEYALYLKLFEGYVGINTMARNVMLQPMLIVTEFAEDLASKKRDAAEVAKADAATSNPTDVVVTK